MRSLLLAPLLCAACASTQTKPDRFRLTDIRPPRGCVIVLWPADQAGSELRYVTGYGMTHVASRRWPDMLPDPIGSILLVLPAAADRDLERAAWAHVSKRPRGSSPPRIRVVYDDADWTAFESNQDVYQRLVALRTPDPLHGTLRSGTGFDGACSIIKVLEAWYARVTFVPHPTDPRRAFVRVRPPTAGFFGHTGTGPFEELTVEDWEQKRVQELDFGADPRRSVSVLLGTDVVDREERLLAIA
ncbi:MAG: hypothetical protein AAGD14_10730 [Planctomycetota bacterium]